MDRINAVRDLLQGDSRTFQQEVEDELNRRINANIEDRKIDLASQVFDAIEDGEEEGPNAEDV